MWFATNRGLTRYAPADGKTARLVHAENDPATLGSNFVRGTLETKDGAFWVATNSTLEVLDRQTGRVTEHFFLRNPLQKSANTGNPMSICSRIVRARSGSRRRATGSLSSTGSGKHSLLFPSRAAEISNPVHGQFSKTARERSGLAPSTG